MDKKLHQGYFNIISYSICLYQNVFFLLIVLQYSSAQVNINLQRKIFNKKKKNAVNLPQHSVHISS